MASASNTQAPSSASTSHPIRWDVFISFRGFDTRYAFTDYLYDALLRAGIQTFKDDDKIRSGESISNALVQAVHESEIYIVVFSENYASSTWCLDELVEMYTCYKARYRMIIPVFFKIEPLVVINQTGSFKVAFEKHGTRFDTARLDTWRAALAQATRGSGYLVPENMSQTFIISEVVNEVSQSINPVRCYGLSSRYLDAPPAEWDVFVSCGDLRSAFIGHLFDALDCTGVRIFKSSPEIHRTGSYIPVTVCKVIQEAKIYVVVLSDKYASSEKCLDELMKIFECCKSTGRLILPVFYNIEPSTVRYQIGSFMKALKEHRTYYGRRDQWHATLTKVGNLLGYEVHNNMSQIDVISKVVYRVLLVKNSSALNVANDPVGLESRVKGIITFLNNVAEHVIKFGIHGTGDGKTTLAKTLFNQLWPGSFRRCCFLDDVKKFSGTADGLVSLQRRLLDEVLLPMHGIKIDNAEQGIEVIRARICKMKVLMVIDGVDDKRTVDFLVGTFAPGSIVIITTENEDLLDSIKVEAKYKVNGPDDAASRQICWNF